MIKNLDMTGCVFVFISPDRQNIFHEVRTQTDIATDMEPFVRLLKNDLADAPKVVVYCQSLNMCADLYAHFLMELGDVSYFPTCAEKTIANRLF